MSNYIVTDSELTSVANAIRTKGGTNGSLVFPGGFTSAISNISGGGGSSDFSTAEVTVINNSEDVVHLSAPLVFDGELLVGKTVSPNSSESVDVVLYNGIVYEVVVTVNDVEVSPSSITGDIVGVVEGILIITGNGTITIS